MAFTDFGRVGTISQVGRDQLADLFLAIVDDDVGLAVDTLVGGSGSPGDIDVTELEREVSRLITKYYNKSLKEVRVGELISEVLDLVRNHHLMMSPELAMLLATLVVLEGLGTQLDPEFDFVGSDRPVRTTHHHRPLPAAGDRSHARAVAPALRALGHRAAGVTDALHAPAGLGRVPDGRLTRRLRTDALKRFEEMANRLAFALVVAAFVIGLSMLLSDTPKPEWFLVFARLAWAGAIGVGSWFFVSIFMARNRHK